MIGHGFGHDDELPAGFQDADLEQRAFEERAIEMRARKSRQRVERAVYLVRAREMWDAMDASEKHGVRFGLFPNAKMEAAEKQGFDGHLICLALMDIAQNDGGMRA